MKHGDLVDAIIAAAPDAGARLFKNHTGVAKHQKGDKQWVTRYGVGPVGGGGGDLIGWRMGDGRFVSIEVKAGRDKLSDAQAKWMRWVRAGGGLAGVARSVEDALAIIRGDPGYDA